MNLKSAGCWLLVSVLCLMFPGEALRLSSVIASRKHRRSAIKDRAIVGDLDPKP